MTRYPYRRTLRRCVGLNGVYRSMADIGGGLAFPLVLFLLVGLPIGLAQDATGLHADGPKGGAFILALIIVIRRHNRRKAMPPAVLPVPAPLPADLVTQVRARALVAPKYRPRNPRRPVRHYPRG